MTNVHITKLSGHPHRDYTRHKPMIDAIFRRFEESQEFGLVSELHRKYHIPVSTLARWRQKHAEDSEWRPYNTSVHGLHHRIFSDAQEAAIKDFVFDNYIKPGIIFRNRDFPKIAMQAFLENFGDDDELKEVASVLLDQALLIEGFMPKDSIEFSNKISKLMVKMME